MLVGVVSRETIDVSGISITSNGLGHLGEDKCDEVLVRIEYELLVRGCNGLLS